MSSHTDMVPGMIGDCRNRSAKSHRLQKRLLNFEIDMSFKKSVRFIMYTLPILCRGLTNNVPKSAIKGGE